MQNDFAVRHLPPNTPIELKGFVIKDAEDFYTIFINPNLSQEEQEKVYEHEFNHIDLNHFYRDMSLEEKESEAENRRFKRKYVLNV